MCYANNLCCVFSCVERSHKEQVAVLEGGEGEEDGESGSDPLQPFTDYYLQAERSVEALVAIR